jgi:hypothetical protein
VARSRYILRGSCLEEVDHYPVASSPKISTKVGMCQICIPLLARGITAIEGHSITGSKHSAPVEVSITYTRSVDYLSGSVNCR